MVFMEACIVFKKKGGYGCMLPLIVFKYRLRQEGLMTTEKAENL